MSLRLSARSARAAPPCPPAGRWSLDRPASTTTRGMPYTTQDSADSVSTCPPAARMARAPASPSSPMPVSTTPTAAAPQLAAALSKSTSTEG